MSYKSHRNLVLLLSLLGISLLFSACSAASSDTDADGDMENSLGETPEADAPLDGDLDSTSGDGDEETSEFDAEVEEVEQPPVCLGTEIQERPVHITTDDTFDLGPYLMHVTETSIVIMWRTVDELPSEVLYGAGDELDLLAADPLPTTVHEIELTGLQSNTRYSYQVRSGNRESGVHSFYTAVGPGVPFRFTVFGDNRSHPDDCSEVVAAMAEVNPYFNINVGDVVTDGRNDEEWKTEWFQPIRPLAHDISTYVAIGNHEKNGHLFYDLHAYPHPQDDPGRESSYSFTYGDAFFLVVDGNKPYYTIYGVETDLSIWVKEQVASEAARNAKWRFAFTHFPGYSQAWGGECSYEGTPSIRNWFLPLLAENGFHAYFAGHTHNYERGMKDGIVQFITGGGGSGLDDLFCTDYEHVTVMSFIYHFINVDVFCDRVRFEAIDIDGNTVDWVELNADQPGVLAGEMEHEQGEPEFTDQ